METPTDSKLRSIYVSFLIISIIAAYSNTLQAPFIFDDQGNILENISIKQIWPPWGPFNVSSDTGITGRPFINFTFALNYAVSGDNVWSYHALNILIHIMAALTLWGVIRHTLENQHWDINKTWNPAWIALGCAVVWALHPLQTQAVTYLSQRCESLMGLFFLLVFYCAVRGWQSSKHQRAWHLSAFLFFILGAGCKEVIAVAPVLLFIYDWLFNRKSPMVTLRSSSFLYTGLTCCLIGEFLLIAAGGTISTGTEKHIFTLTEYWLTQPSVILHYIRLVFWPSDLALDYGMDFHGMIETWPALVIVIALIIISLWSLYRRHPAGFLMAWFLMILAPTSLYPLPDPVFEHRMYLPSIAIIIFAVIGLYKLEILMVPRFIPDADAQQLVLAKASRYTMALLILAVGISTYTRNLYYQSDISIWADNVIKRPRSARVQIAFGKALSDIERPVDAIRHLEMAIQILKSQSLKAHQQTLFTAYHNLGAAYLQVRQWKTAEYYLKKALQTETPRAYGRASVHSNLGIALAMLERNDEALFHFRQAILIEPNYVNGHVNYGAFFCEAGDLKEAAAHYQIALNLKPAYFDANIGMGKVMYRQGRYSEARIYFQKALSLKAEDAYAHNMLIELDKKVRP